MPTLSDILQQVPRKSCRVKKPKKPKRKKPLHVQEQKYSLIWRWRRRRS